MDFYFYLDYQGSLADAISRLKGKGNVPQWTRRLNPFGVFTHIGIGEGFVIEAQDVFEQNRYRCELRQAYHLDPTIKFRFIIDHFDYDRSGNYLGVVPTLTACCVLLEDLPGNAVLLSKDNSILMQRKEGRVELNKDGDFWKPSRLVPMNVIPHQVLALQLAPLTLSPSL